MVAVLVQVVLTKKGPDDDTVKRLTECGLTRGQINQVRLQACPDLYFLPCNLALPAALHRAGYATMHQPAMWVRCPI